jgi:hypothetical protein
MSYCRWSSDNWTSDVYVYYNVSNLYCIHVAGMRIEGIENLPRNNELDRKFWADELDEDEMKQYQELYESQMRFIDSCPQVKIGGKYDGDSFYLETIEDLIEKLEDIQSHGYHVPTWLFDDLREECE